MNSYIQIEFQNIPADKSDLLIAELAMIGFEGFEEADNNLKAFVPEKDFDETAVKEIAEKNELVFIQSTIEETNWNAVWESNFQPISVNDFVGIRAHFHEPIKGVDYEIVITPKMSFGTGHHATTYMMIEEMRKIDFKNKTVFDFGTGTGILAILAEMLGAKKIIAIDNDDWSIANTAENLQRNNCTKVELAKAENAAGEGQYDIILANINKNVIIDNLSSLIKQLSPGGILLLSGLLQADEQDILSEVGKFPLQFVEKNCNNNWIALMFRC